ncbi:hypothetical protein ON010_g2007 [Phytophthora cinnamomi]|nr:hypothetical protein ON010_g2007 [Phytophthora cinnamomi]
MHTNGYIVYEPDCETPTRLSCCETLPRRVLQPKVTSELPASSLYEREEFELVVSDQHSQPSSENKVDECPEDLNGDLHNPCSTELETDGPVKTGFKRIDRSQASFADENPYSSLEIMNCEFETFDADFTLGTTTGILVIPHLSPSGATQEDSEPLPTKRRSSTFGNPSSNTLVAEEEILVAAEEAELESHEDRVAQNMQHLKAIETLQKTSKNMDKIAASITAMPLAWSTALCADLAEDGEYAEELASIHLLNHVLAKLAGAECEPPFNKRVVAYHLPLGKTRKTFMQVLVGERENRNPFEIDGVLIRPAIAEEVESKAAKELTNCWHAQVMFKVTDCSGTSECETGKFVASYEGGRQRLIWPPNAI